MCFDCTHNYVKKGFIEWDSLTRITAYVNLVRLNVSYSAMFYWLIVLSLSWCPSMELYIRPPKIHSSVSQSCYPFNTISQSLLFSSTAYIKGPLILTATVIWSCASIDSAIFIKGVRLNSLEFYVLKDTHMCSPPNSWRTFI